MNATIFKLTVREFISRRQSLLLFLFAAMPVGLAVIFRISDPRDQQDWTANFLMDGTVVTIVLPLASLILSTAAIGSEIENGTVLYLLTKPISRLEIVGAKFAAAAMLLVIFIVPATATAGFIAIQGAPESGVVIGFTLAVAAGALAYVALFLLLSVVTSRALLAGLAYVIIWETLVTELFPATSYVSVRQYCLGIADTIASGKADEFQAELGAEALVLAAAVTVGALLLATRRLETLEISESE